MSDAEGRQADCDSTLNGFDSHQTLQRLYVMELIFPIYHSACDSCERRFECMTTKVRKEVSDSTIDLCLPFAADHLPSKFSLNCFKIEPFRKLELKTIGNVTELLIYQ